MRPSSSPRTASTPSARSARLGVAGVAVVAGFDPTNLASGTTIGVLLVLLGAVSFALGGVLTRPLSTDLPMESTTGWAMGLGGFLLLAGAVARGEPVGNVAWTETALLSFAYLTVVSAILGFLIYFTLMERVGPTQLNLVGYLEPVVAALAGWALLGQGVDAATISGFATIFAGFALVKRRALYDVAMRTTAAVTS
ncbi:DMT family transporter [Halospeciosus flavus]|uniref:DMT family transporter n=1 Tax=Halospeciosus flavus TaxID=3032283 RepID=UPI00361D82DA